MAHSFKHYPAYGLCGTSDKFLKLNSHRATRTRVRVELSNVIDPDSMALTEQRELVSVYDGVKDGKGYLLHSTNEAKPYVIRPRRGVRRLVLVANCEPGSPHSELERLELMRNCVGL